VPHFQEGDPGSTCSAIYTVIVRGKTYYLVITNGTYSTKDISQSIGVLNIENNQLVDTVRLFKTKTRVLNQIDVNFDFFSVVDRPERPLALIVYDEKQNSVRIPVVNGKGQVTKRNLIYKLQDKYFTYRSVE
jgi:hypothetical protein